MRYSLLRKHSTYPERLVYEILKELKIPFKHRWTVEGREVDFLLGQFICLEINGHDQSVIKNKNLLEKGYTIHHLGNQEIISNRENIKQQIKDLWHVNKTHDL